MDIVTPAEMEQIDRATIDEHGLPSLVLMENAARSVAGFLPPKGDIGILVGPGNNGGDGLVLSRVLYEQGRGVEVLLLSNPSTPDAEKNLDLARDWGVPCRYALEDGDQNVINDFFRGKDVLVDAIFGTGLARPLEGRFRYAVEQANSSSIPITAIDIASGVDGRSGQILGCAVKAGCTVTFGRFKRGHLLLPGRAHCGALHLTQPGFHPEALKLHQKVKLFTPELAARQLPSLWCSMHKGDNGRLLMVTGSERYPGAGLLSTLGALRAGAGLVTHSLPAALRDLSMQWTPEAIPWPREEPLDLHAFNAAVVGCGLGREARAAALTVLSCEELPAVVDADALPLLHELPPARRERLVATPHPGELSRLLDRTVNQLERDRIEAAREAAATLGCTVCFKGVPTVTAAPDGRTYVNSTGNSVLAQGGTGDLLSGVIGAYLAYGLPPLEAGASGAFIHGLAADLARERIGPRGVVAHQIADFLPLAYADVVGNPSLGPVF